MCNHRHPEHGKILVAGKGWKICRRIGEEIFPMFNEPSTPYHLHQRNTWIDPYGLIEPKVSGFCFFLYRRVAQIALKLAIKRLPTNDRFILLSIRYYGGLCRQVEDKMFNGCQLEIALCKEFEIIQIEEV